MNLEIGFIHLRSERFPSRRKSKLHPSGDGLFQVLERINDNAYKIDLPGEYGNVSATFNVADLSLYDAGDSRANPFEEGGNDGDHAAAPASNQPRDLLQGLGGPMTRARSKRMKEALQGLIMEMQSKEAVLDVFPRLINYSHLVEESQPEAVLAQSTKTVISGATDL